MEHVKKNSGYKRRVLVVDDEMINCEILKNILGSKYQVETAMDGEEAFRYISEARPPYSLILLDLLMPKMDGFEFIKKVRANEELKSTPVIVMTSEADAEVESINLGAADFITKPYDMPEVILARCDRIIELSEDKTIIKSA